MSKILCWLTGHRLTVVRRGEDHYIPQRPGPIYGRNCRCGRRHTVIMSDGTERETTT